MAACVKTGILFISMAVIGVASCASPNYAPVYYGQSGKYASRAKVDADNAGSTPKTAPAPRRVQTAKVESAPIAPIAPPPAEGHVRVEAGQTLYQISRANQVSLETLIAANSLQAPYRIYVGQDLRLPQERTHTIGKGDTLYSLSRRYDTTVSSLALANNLNTPYTLSLGQKLRIPEQRATGAVVAQNAPRVESDGVTRQKLSPVVQASLRPSGAGARFVWPVRGETLSDFGPKASGQRNDGINIAAAKGTPIRAAADGVVAYRGSEIRGYGNLVLLRHPDGWVTAYAHADSISVRKGQHVQAGEVIGKVGASGSVDRPQLHFEVRRNVKAYDPQKMLAQNS